MDVLIKFISDLFGIPIESAEGGIATFFAFVLVISFKLLWDSSRRDNKQVDLEHTLAQLALDTFTANRTTIQKNTEAIEKIGNLLDGMKTSFTDLTQELRNVVSGVKILTEKTEENQPVLENIKDSLLKTSKTIVVVKDADDSILAKLTAEPDEEGNLVIRFNSVLENVE